MQIDAIHRLFLSNLCGPEFQNGINILCNIERRVCSEEVNSLNMRSLFMHWTHAMRLCLCYDNTTQRDLTFSLHELTFEQRE